MNFKGVMTMTKRKLIPLLLASAMALSLAACGKSV